MAVTNISYTPDGEIHVPFDGNYPASTRQKFRFLIGSDVTTTQYLFVEWNSAVAKRTAIVLAGGNISLYISDNGTNFQARNFAATANTVVDIEVNVSASLWAATLNGVAFSAFDKFGSYQSHATSLAILGGTQDGSATTFDRPIGGTTAMYYSIENADTNEVLQEYVLSGNSPFLDIAGVDDGSATSQFGSPAVFAYDDVAKTYTRDAVIYDATNAGLDPNITPPANTAPVVTLSKSVDTITEGGVYTLPNVTVEDDNDSGLGHTWSGTADVNTAGVYVFTATSDADSGGLTGSATYTLTVQAATIPDIARNGVLMWGQSNMVGVAAAEAQDQDYSLIANRVYQVGMDDATLRPATNPLDHYGSFDTMGMWLEAVKPLDDDLVIIPAGSNGAGLAATDTPNYHGTFNTSVTDYSLGARYPKMLQRAQEFEALNAGNKITRVVACIGETDADKNKTGAEYKTAMNEVRNGLIAGTRITADTEWVLVGISGSTTPSNVAVINTAMQELASEWPNASYVDVTDLPKSDTYHYTAAGLRTAGQRVNAEFMDMIQLNSGTDVIQVGDAWVDAGAQAYDATTGAFVSVTGIGSVDVNTVGTYSIEHDYTDASGNVSTTKTRSVSVLNGADTEAPVLTLNGTATQSHTQGEAYTDLGASWTDNVDGSGTVLATTPLDVNTLGAQVLSYQYTDAAVNASNVVTRTVTVVAAGTPDTTKPVITITAGTDTVDVGDAWADAGATWTDNVDGSGSVTDVTSNVNTAVAGVYQVQYNHTDAAGNVGDTATRTVTVEAVVSGADPAIYKDVHFEGSLSKHVDMGEIEAYQGDTLRLSGSILDNDGNALTTGNLVIKMFGQTHTMSLTGHLFVDVPDNAFANNVVTVTADAPDMGGNKAQVRVSSLTIAIQD